MYLCKYQIRLELKVFFFLGRIDLVVSIEVKMSSHYYSMSPYTGDRVRNSLFFESLSFGPYELTKIIS